MEHKERLEFWNSGGIGISSSFFFMYVCMDNELSFSVKWQNESRHTHWFPVSHQTLATKDDREIGDDGRKDTRIG